MAHNGYADQILVLHMDSKTWETVPTDDYKDFIGGHAMATALFWHFASDVTVEPLDPGNPLIFAATPFSGTIVPSASSRTSVCAVSPFTYPKHWLHHSSLGGRVGAEMKRAGYDAVVICGAAEEPTWVSVVDGDVRFHDASQLWGLDSWETQKAVRKEMRGTAASGAWKSVDGRRDSGASTQDPSIVCIGPAGENKSALAAIMHDAGHAAGQGGMGAVMGSKMLKAVAILGTGSVSVADPAALLDLRVETQRKFGYNVDDPKVEAPVPNALMYNYLLRAPGSFGILWNTRNNLARPEGCYGCFRNCRTISSDTVGNEGVCNNSNLYTGRDSRDNLRAADIMNKLGLNGFEMDMVTYPYALYQKGLLGKGKQIESSIHWENYGDISLYEEVANAVAYRTDIGEVLADGIVPASVAWGRYDEDKKLSREDGGTNRVCYNYVVHYDPRIATDFGFTFIFSDRDLDHHAYNQHTWWAPNAQLALGMNPVVGPQETAELLARSTGLDDPMCFDYSEEGIYSDANMRNVEWIIHYSRMWLDTMGFCDFTWPALINVNDPSDRSGSSPELEGRYFKAVTGVDLTWDESLELGRKFYLFERAIWALQGRERADEEFDDHLYGTGNTACPAPQYDEATGEWSWFLETGTRRLDRDKVDDYRTRFYRAEGCDEETGVPTEETLRGYGLDEAADALKAAGKL